MTISNTTANAAENLTRYSYDGGYVFTSETQAMLCPLDGNSVLIEPAFCTAVAPPAAEPGFAAQFDANAQTWARVVDHRGEVWFTANAEPVLIATVGDPTTYAEPLAKDRPAVEMPKPVYTTATKLGLKRAFTALGDWDKVKAAIASDADVQEDWDLAVTISRTDPIVQALQAKLDLTDDQVTAIIASANELTA